MPLENKSNGYKDSQVLVYGTLTLQEINSSTRLTLPNTIFKDGAPCVTVNPSQNCLYISPYNNVTRIYAFNLSNFSSNPAQDIVLQAGITLNARRLESLLIIIKVLYIRLKIVGSYHLSI